MSKASHVRYRVDISIALAIGAMALVLLNGFPPAYQHWDALVYAYRAKDGQLAASLYSHHALSNLLFYANVRAMSVLGVTQDSIRVFQTTNAALGALAAAAMYSLARAWENSRLAAAGLSMILIVSYGFWHYAGTSDLYIWIVLVTIAFWWSAARARKHPGTRELILAGVLAGIAILSWQGNGLLALVFGLAYLLDAVRERHSITRLVLCYGVLGVAFTLVGYVLLGYLAGSRSAAELAKWFVGYFGNANYGGRLSLETWQLVRESAQKAVLTQPYASWIYRLAWSGMWLAVAGFFAAAIWGGWRAGSWQASFVRLNLIWAGGLGLAAWWFDPGSAKFWLVICLGLQLTAVVGFAYWRNVRMKSLPLVEVMPALLALGLFLFNWVVGIRPEHQLKNFQIAAAVTWQQHTQSDDLLIVGPDFRTYLDYYGDRHRVLCQEYAFDAVFTSNMGSAANWLRQAIERAQADAVTVFRADNICAAGVDELTGWCSAEMLAVLNGIDWSPAFTVYDGRELHTVSQAVVQRQP